MVSNVDLARYGYLGSWDCDTTSSNLHFLSLTCNIQFEKTQSQQWNINRTYDGGEAETRKSQASFQIIYSYARLAEHKT